MAKPYEEGSGWAMRQRYDGHDIYKSGYQTMRGVEDAVRDEIALIKKNKLPRGRGPKNTTAAQAMQNYALERLPFKKGAVQEAVRMNHYLRAAGLQTLVTTKLERPNPSDTDTVYFKVSLAEHTDIRKIPKGLSGHRKAQMTKTADARKHRAVLAGMDMQAIQRADIQGYMDAMRKEKTAPATMKLEQALWRGLYNHAFTTWNWKSLDDNPATLLCMPQVDNERDRVMSMQEQELMDAALHGCKNTLVAPVSALLRETAMRSSEPLETARWRDVNWDAKVLHLRDSKNKKRDVPLSPVALQILRNLQEMDGGGPDDRIVKISYEALKAAWTRACERAGIENLKIHDLRHTAATRMALKSGNVFLVKALTGHKALASVMRYANVKASDVVDVMHAPEPEQPTAVQVNPQTVNAGVSTDQLQEAIAQATLKVMQELQGRQAPPQMHHAQAGNGVRPQGEFLM